MANLGITTYLDKDKHGGPMCLLSGTTVNADSAGRIEVIAGEKKTWSITFRDVSSGTAANFSVNTAPTFYSDKIPNAAITFTGTAPGPTFTGTLDLTSLTGPLVTELVDNTEATAVVDLHVDGGSSQPVFFRIEFLIHRAADATGVAIGGQLVIPDGYAVVFKPDGTYTLATIP